MLRTLLRLRNAIDYPLRQIFRWRRGGFVPRAGSKEGLFAHLPAPRRQTAEQLEARLREQYDLANFERGASADNYRENLFYIHMLETALERSACRLPDALLAADIGPSHWFYVQGLYALLRRWQAPAGRAVQLEGYEADPYRIYADLRSRYDHAVGHLRGLMGAVYLPRPFSPQPARFQLILMLFPFVFEQDHLEWGLPGGLFHPDDLLGAAWQSLQPGGTLLIVNQGAAEHARQHERLLALGIEPTAAFAQDDLLYTYAYQRFVLVARRGD
jgi:hypothetical protein